MMFNSQNHDGQNLPRLEEMTDILDIEGIIPSIIPLIIQFLTILGLIVLSALVIFMLWKIWKRKKQASQDANLTPSERFFKRMNELEAKAFLKSKAPKKHYFAITEIARMFLSEQFQCAAVDMTTQEISKLLPKLGIGSTAAESLLDFFDKADLVKFAGALPNEDEIGKHAIMLKEFVKQSATRPT